MRRPPGRPVLAPGTRGRRSRWTQPALGVTPARDDRAGAAGRPPRQAAARPGRRGTRRRLARPWSLRRIDSVKAIHDIDVLGDHFLDDLAGRLDGVHPGHDLPDEVIHELLRAGTAVGRPADPGLGLGD